MTYATVRSAAEHIARAGKITPHQLAALTAHDESLTDAQRQEFTELWRAAGSPAAAVPALVSMAQAVAVFTKAPSPSQLADLNACLARFNINTPARIQHFLAQVGHESGGLKWMLELASGGAYEGRKDLGNTQQGDGPRFKGAGAIQLTGRFNYQKFADYIKDIDVMDGAAYVASRYPFSSAGFWWHQNAINAFVDQGANCRQVSAKVNGRDPANGLADREAYFNRAVAAIPQQAPRLTPSSPLSTKVTPHITYGELCLGEDRRRFINQAQCDIATELCTFIEKARAQFGNQPIIITSAHRPKAVNDAVNGAADSEHLYKPGCGAIDWYIKDISVKLVQDWCDLNWPFSLGYGAPKGFVHLGVRAGSPRPRVRWDY
jgi:predicted chitinase